MLMRTFERIRAEQECPRCLAKPGQRCVTVDDWAWSRSNHPERNRAFTQRKADEMRGAASPNKRKDADG
jgi:hypothetical protein